MRVFRTRNLGFTLIELMVTVALAATVMFLAVPNLSVFKRNAELTSATNSLVASISTARSEALKRNFNVFVMTTGAGIWTSGWTVFVDTNGNGRYEPASDITINTQEALPSYFEVTGGHLNPETNTRYVMFNGSGFVKKLGLPTLAFSTDNNNPNTSIEVTRRDLPAGRTKFDETRRIFVAITGRTRSCKPKSAIDPDCSS